MQTWADLGISTRRRSGEEKTHCPQCRWQRKHTNDKSLSVNHDKGVFNCHHCRWTGTLGEKPNWTPARVKKAYRKPEYKPVPAVQQIPEKRAKLLAWFEQRGIPAQIVDEAGIEIRKHFIPAKGKEEFAIAFPYKRDGEVVNVKYRTSSKDFAVEKDAELWLYGYDEATASESDTLYLCEGEADVLAMRAAGIYNVVSVPNGSNSNLDFLADCEGWLDGFQRIVFAGDTDTAGLVLADELQRRIGVEKSWRVEWPSDCTAVHPVHEKRCKDANDVLLHHGKEALLDCLNNARPVPIEGAYHAGDYAQRIYQLYSTGRDRGLSVGFNAMDEFYRVAPGEWTVVTGIPKSGKSVWMMNVAVNMAVQHDWRFVIYPPENLPGEEYMSCLLEIWAGMPFDDGPTPRMTPDVVQAGIQFLNDHFVILDPGDDEQTLDGILKQARAFVKRWGANGLVIDPWNEVDHEIRAGESEHDYTGRSLRKFGKFVRLNNMHGWIVTHPTKLQKDKDGDYPVPTLYDISGSSHWHNKSHMGISVWRDLRNDDTATQFHIQKVKRRWRGRLGRADLYHHKVTGQFTVEPPKYDFRRGYEWEPIPQHEVSFDECPF